MSLHDLSGGVEESKTTDPPSPPTPSSPTTTADAYSTGVRSDSGDPMDLGVPSMDLGDLTASSPSSTPVSRASTAVSLDQTISRLQLLVDAKLDDLAAGIIPELDAQTMALMDRLVSLSEAARVSRESERSVPPVDSSGNSAVRELTQSFAAVLSQKHTKQIALSPADVKQIPRLTGDADVDVNSCLSQYRLIASFKVKSHMSANTPPAELETASDKVAFEFVSLICDGPILVLYQHIMDGSVNWKAPVTMSEQSNPAGKYTPPANWAELKTALLDCLMPSNIVEESALRLVTFKQGASETASSYALRYSTECARFEAAVQRVSPGRSPYAALSVVLFQHGLKPAIQCLSLSDAPAKSLAEAVDRARRYEAANLTGGLNASVSAVSFTHVPNRTAIAQQFTQAAAHRSSLSSTKPKKSFGGRGSGGNGSNGNRSGGGASGKRPARQSGGGGGGGSGSGGGRGSKPRPVCTYPGCEKPVGHEFDTCFQRKREERKARGDNSGDSSGGNGKRPRKDTRSNDDDDP